MTSQLDLLSVPTPGSRGACTVRPPGRARVPAVSWAAKFDRWRIENPEAYAAVEREALHCKSIGMRRVSVRDLFAFARRHQAERNTGCEGYRFNNGIAAPMARALITSRPELAEVISTRGNT